MKNLYINVRNCSYILNWLWKLRLLIRDAMCKELLLYEKKKTISTRSTPHTETHYVPKTFFHYQFTASTKTPPIWPRFPTFGCKCTHSLRCFRQYSTSSRTLRNRGSQYLLLCQLLKKIIICIHTLTVCERANDTCMSIHG